MRIAYVDILSNLTRTLYIGVTTDLARRLWDHRHDRVPGTFASRYNLDRLVFYETYPDVRDAIAREKQLKGWVRQKKLHLIETMNPPWDDLSLHFPCSLDDP